PVALLVCQRLTPLVNMTPRTSNDMTRLLLFASVSPSRRCCLLIDLDDLYSLSLQRHFSTLTKFSRVESRFYGRKQRGKAAFDVPINPCGGSLRYRNVAVRLCSVRKILAARSPITTHGAIVLPVVTRGMMAASAILRPAIPYTATVLRLPSHQSPST